MVNLKKNVLTETHKKNWASQHSELLYWRSNRQFKSKMDLPLKKVSKINRGALTSASVHSQSRSYWGGSGEVSHPPAMSMVVISGKLPSKNQVNYELQVVSCQRKISWITQKKIASEFEIKLYL